MTARVLAIALFAQLALACANNDSDEPEPTETHEAAASADEPPRTWCEDKSAELVAVGAPYRFRVHASSVTQSCRCKYTTHPQWSCSSDKVCESEYDLGSTNPQVCTIVDRTPATILSGIVDAGSACTGTVTPLADDPTSADVTVTCSAEGEHFASVRLATSAGDALSDALLVVTEDGKCPPTEAR